MSTDGSNLSPCIPLCPKKPCFVCADSTAQHALAIDKLHMLKERMIKLPMFADTEFWRPLEASTDNSDIVATTTQRPMIFSAGLERRDYTDVIRDLRNNGRGLVKREWWPSFLDNPEVADTLGRLPTDFYVTPGDPDELREMIQYLLNHPEVAEELGRNGRRVIEEYFTLEAFAQRQAAAILGKAYTIPKHNTQREATLKSLLVTNPYLREHF